MIELKKNLFASVATGAIFSVVWVILSLVSTEALFFLAKAIWMCLGVVVLGIFLALPRIRSKLIFLLSFLAILAIMVSIGKLIGLEVLGYLGFPPNLEAYAECWLIYPIVGLLCFDFVCCPFLVWFTINDGETKKTRWGTTVCFFSIFMVLSIFAVTGYWVVNLL